MVEPDITKENWYPDKKSRPSARRPKVEQPNVLRELFTNKEQSTIKRTKGERDE